MTEQTITHSEAPDITVVVVNYNTGHLLDRLFAALAAAQGDLQIQTIVIDNASRDNSVEILRSKYPTVELTENAMNVGFGRANNQAAPRIRGRYVLLLNTDAFVSSDTLSKTLSFMEQNPRCGILGVKLVGEDGSLQPCCRFFPTPWNVFLVATGLNRFFPGARLVDDMNWDHSRIRECDWVPGCYYLVRKQVIDQIGLFDPNSSSTTRRSIIVAERIRPGGKLIITRIRRLCTSEEKARKPMRRCRALGDRLNGFKLKASFFTFESTMACQASWLRCS